MCSELQYGRALHPRALIGIALIGIALIGIILIGSIVVELASNSSSDADQSVQQRRWQAAIIMHWNALNHLMMQWSA